MCHTARGQVEKQVASSITDVTVFLSRAQVTRQLKTRIEVGKTSLVLGGLTSQLDPASVQVSGKGNFIILGTSHRQNYMTELTMPPSLRALRDSLEYYQRLLSQEQNQREIINKEEALLMANQKIGGANANLTVNELKTMADFYRSRLGDLAKNRMKQEETIKGLSTKISRIQAQYNSENELYRRNTSEIVIDVSAEAATAVEMEIRFVVSNARWSPVYDLRVNNIKGPVQLAYKANVYQSTGEDWKGVRLKLSTANPNLGGVKPELASQYVDFYQPMVYKRDRGPEQMVKASMAGEASESMQPMDAETAASLFSTIQTSLNTEFAISIPYTVLSSNKSTLVDIRSHEMKATYQYAAVPKLDADAFLIARATGWEEFSLLPGAANVFFEETFVGKSYIDPNSIRDTLSVSLGRDKRIVVKREKVKDFTQRRAIGTNIRDSYAYEVSVRNTKQEPIVILLEDQVPVTKNSQIEVTLSDAGGGTYNKDTGKLTWTWTIPPNETRKTVFRFELKYPRDKQVNTF